jgi:Tol biopolymer transport system component
MRHGFSLILAVALATVVGSLEARPSANAAHPGNNGKIAYFAQEGAVIGIYTIEPDGGDNRFLATGNMPAWSPDGTELAMSLGNRIRKVNEDGGGQQQLTDDATPGTHVFPTWSPDGSKIAFISWLNNAGAIWTMNANGSSRTKIFEGAYSLYDLTWSPNGDELILHAQAVGSPGSDIYKIGAGGGGLTNITQSGTAVSPDWSPDAGKIVYIKQGAQGTAGNRLMVANADGSDAQQINSEESHWPAWSPDGQYIFYASSGGDLKRITPGGSSLTTLNSNPDRFGPGYSSWQPAPDRFVHSIEFTQAIQELQSVPSLKAGLEDDGQPPVNLVAGKPTAMRIYFNELDAETSFIVDTNLSSMDVLTVQYAGCDPEETRRREDICEAPEVHFLPPEGEWTAEVTIKAANGEVLEEHEFEFNTPESQALVLVAIAVCDELESGNWWCGDTTRVASNATLLRMMAPTDDVRVIVSPHTIRREWDGTVGSAWFDAVHQDLENLVAVNPALVAVPGERRILVGAVRGNDEDGAPQGVLGTAGFDGFVAVAKTQTSTLGRDDSQDTLAHEVGHALNVDHTGTGVPAATEAPGCYAAAIRDEEHMQVNGPWPYADNYLRSGAPPGEIEVGYAVEFSQELKGDTTMEIMGYCGPSWISPHTWEAMHDGINGPFLSTAGAGMPGPPGEYWLVSGSIDNDVANFDPLFKLQANGQTGPGAGDYRIVVRNSGGSALYTRLMDLTTPRPRPEPGIDPGEAPTLFSQTIPVQQGAASIAVVGPGDETLGEIDLTGVPPAVAFNSAGPSTSSSTSVVSWTVTDPDSAEHTAWLEYSADNGATWASIAPGIADTTTPIDFSMLPGGDQALLRVTVSDGVNSGSAVSAPFAVARKGPQAQIILPTNDASYAVGHTISLRANAFDPEDGTLDGNSVTWTSSRDGLLGNGQGLTVLDLSVGTHTITLTARDSDNNASTDSITITVAEASLNAADVDCNGNVNASDALKLLRHTAGLPVEQMQPCPQIGSGEPPFGDANCDGATNAGDALAILRHTAGLAVNLPPGCPVISAALRPKPLVKGARERGEVA